MSLMQAAPAPQPSLWAEYARHVLARWWFLVGSVVGGALTVASLLASIAIPWPVGLAILVVCLLAAQALAFGDMRHQRVRASGARPDRLDLLRERYQRGRSLQAAPRWLGGPAPTSREEARGGDARRRQATLRWAQATWRMLRERFPPLEEGFCPYGIRWGRGDFRMAFEEEVDRRYGSAEAYLEDKMAFLARLLQEQEARSRA
jgi:hypothetical protein